MLCRALLFVSIELAVGSNKCKYITCVAGFPGTGRRIDSYTGADGKEC